MIQKEYNSVFSQSSKQSWQLKQHYHSVLNQELKHGPLEKDEKKFIKSHLEEIETNLINCKQCAIILKRPESVIKNYYYKITKRKEKTSFSEKRKDFEEEFEKIFGFEAIYADFDAINQLFYFIQ
jgi:hypothetical protein